MMRRPQRGFGRQLKNRSMKRTKTSDAAAIGWIGLALVLGSVAFKTVAGGYLDKTGPTILRYQPKPKSNPTRLPPLARSDEKTSELSVAEPVRTTPAPVA